MDLEHPACLLNDVPRRERLSGSVRRARVLAAPAADAGVELEELPLGEVLDATDAEAPRLFDLLRRDRRQIPQPLLLRRDAEPAGDDVEEARVRHRRDEAERADRVDPPGHQMQEVRLRPPHAREAEPLREEQADEGELRLLRVLPDDPQTLCEVAAHTEEEERAEDDEVTCAMTDARISAYASREEPASAHEQRDPCELQGHLEHGVVHTLVKDRVSGAPAHEIVSVVLDGDEPAPCREHTEAPEEQRVRTRRAATPSNRPLGEDPRGKLPQRGGDAHARCVLTS